jgi:nucleoside-specific outer membrane channel protein Tsx
MKAVNYKKVVVGVFLGTIMAIGSMSSAFAADYNHTKVHHTTVPAKKVESHQNVTLLTAGAAPTLSAVAGTATLPTGTYYVRYTYVTDKGETAASAESSLAVTLGQNLQIVVPTLPSHANSINIYISSSTNTETKQVNTTSTTYDQSAPLVTGVAYPTTNTTTVTGTESASNGSSLSSYYHGAHNVKLSTGGAAPTLSAVAGTATLPTGTYYVRYTYVTDQGETAASAESSLAVTLGQNLQIVVPAMPTYAKSINIYISSTSNTETKQANTTSTTFDQSAPLVTGVAYPTTNTTTNSTGSLTAGGTSHHNGTHVEKMTNGLSNKHKKH